jgi:hypothetical protein
MANSSLTYLSVIKQQVKSQETLMEYLSKLTAMLHIALNADSLDSSKSTLHDFLWVLNDLVNKAKETSECILSSLLKAEFDETSSN